MEKDDTVSPLILLEEDLLLAIPLVPMHSDSDPVCVRTLEEWKAGLDCFEFN